MKWENMIRNRQKQNTKTWTAKLRLALFSAIFELRWLIVKIKFSLKKSELRWQNFLQEAGICGKCLDHAGCSHAPGKSVLMILFGLNFLLSLQTAALAHPIDMEALAQIESSNNPEAVGRHGEIGLYQISPIVLRHFSNTHPEIRIEPKHLKSANPNLMVAQWYMGWLYDRCWTVKDTLIAWNWGIGNWREWKEAHRVPYNLLSDKWEMPETTKVFLEKYKNLTGEEL